MDFSLHFLCWIVWIVLGLVKKKTKREVIFANSRECRSFKALLSSIKTHHYSESNDD